MPAIALTEISVRNLRPPEKGQVIYTDRTLPGFGVRCTPGSKSYVLTYGTRRKRVTIGDVSLVSLKRARDKARTILATPKDEQPTLTFKSALDSFLALHVKPNNRRSTATETERLITKHFEPLYSRRLASLKTGDVLAITDGLLTAGKPSEANHAFTAVKTLLRWAQGRGYLPHSPLEGARKPYRPVSRDRWLTDQELAKLLVTAQNQGVYGQLVLALLYTGQRLAQIVNLRRTWVEGDTLRFPAAIMKSGREHLIPIGPATQALLSARNTDPLFANKRGEPYNDLAQTHAALLKASGIPHFTRHDLRRTYSTGMARLGVAPHIIERLLDHSTGTISGVAAIYNRHHFLPEMREAVERWERHLTSLLP